MPSKIGRPTTYKPEYVRAVDDYLAVTGKEQTHLPKIVSFAIKIGVSERKLYKWAKKHKAFGQSLAKIKQHQLERLLDDGMYGGKEVNAAIVKLILTNNHGFSDVKKHEWQGRLDIVVNKIEQTLDRMLVDEAQKQGQIKEAN